MRGDTLAAGVCTLVLRVRILEAQVLMLARRVRTLAPQVCALVLNFWTRLSIIRANVSKGVNFKLECNALDSRFNAELVLRQLRLQQPVQIGVSRW